MFSYFAYGLGIHSALPLPEFIPAETQPDVVIHLEYSNTLPEFACSENPDKPWQCFFTPGEITFVVWQVGVFSVRQGREVWITALSNIDERMISLYVTGTVMAFLSYQRGWITLHASAVEVDGEAIGFVGESGAGKSSTAAALRSRGHKIITDDILPIRLDQTASVFPAFPQLKLSPEVASSLGYDLQSLLILHPRLSKLGHRVADDFSRFTLPLKSVYILAEGSSLCIEKLSSRQALLELVQHSYGVLALQQVVNSPTYFAQCVELTQKISFYRLTRPFALAALPELAKEVEAHCRNEDLLNPKLVA